MKRTLLAVLIAITAGITTVAVPGCALRYTTIEESTVSGFAKPFTKDKVFDVVSATIMDTGFDPKIANKDMGLMTTEWKKVGELFNPEGPPFDLFFSVKAKVVAVNGSPKVSLLPLLRAVNRRNSGAYTELPLMLVDEAGFKTRGYAEASTLYAKLLKAIAEGLGIQEGAIQHTNGTYDLPM